MPTLAKIKRSIVDKIVMLLFILLTSLTNKVYSQNPFLQFAFNTGGDKSASGESTVIDHSGNVYITGYFSSTTDFDPGPGVANLTPTGSVSSSNGFIAKYTSGGSYQWAFSIPNSGPNALGSSISVDYVGNVYVTGNFRGTADFDPGPGVANLISKGLDDIFVAKYNSSGIYQWAFNIGGTNSDFGYSIKSDVSGNIYVTGSFEGTADFDPGAGTSNLSPIGLMDIFVAKYDASGNYQWAFNIGTSSSFELGKSITIDNSSNVYITGTFYNVTDFDPGPGIANLFANGPNDIFLAKYNSSGVYQWAFKAGGGASDVGYNVATDNTGNIYLSGYFQGFADFDPGPGSGYLFGAGAFLAKYNPAGNYQWAIPVNNTGNGGTINIGSSISTDLSGNVYLTGNFSNTADFDPGAATANLTATGDVDIFVAKYNSSGNYQWAFNTGGLGNNVGNSIAVDELGSIYVTGNFRGSTDFDPTSGTTILSANSSDIFLAKYSTCSFINEPAQIFGNTSICSGSTNTYSVAPVVGAISYSWTLPLGWTGTSSTTTINALAGTTGGNVSVVANNICGPSSTQSLHVTVNPALDAIVDLLANPSGAICPGKPITFRAVNSGSAPAINYDFKINGQTLQSGTNTTYTTSSLANGDVVTCTVTFTGTCLISATAISNSITIIVSATPVISFNPPERTILSGNSVRLNPNVSVSGVSYLWTPSTGLNDPSLLNPLATPTVTTTYKLHVISTDGCVADNTIRVNVFNDIYIPNAFVPNGNPLNRVFRIPPGTNLKLEYFIIYDRLGNTIFSSTDINKGWDGTYKGVKALEGTYVYIIKGNDFRGDVFLKGTVLLIR